MSTIHVAVRATLPFADVGGLERASHDLNLGLARAGVKVCVHTPTIGESETGNGIVYCDVPWPGEQRGRLSFPWRYAQWNRRLAHSLRRCVKPGDAVLYHGASVGSCLVASFDNADITALLNPHGLEEFGPMRLRALLTRPLMRLMIRFGSKKVWRVIATDNSLREHIQLSLHRPSEEVVTIPNGVDIRQLKSQAAQGTSLNTGWFVSSVGRLAHNKGFDLLAEALAEIDQRNGLPCGWRWIHFGSGQQRHVLQSIIESNGLTDRVEIVAGADDETVQATVAQSAMFIQPSRFEGSSLTALEAMAHERLVVATPVGGLVDKIDDGETGVLAAGPDAASIAAAIERALTLDSKTIGMQAGQLVQNHFSIDHSVRLHQELLENARQVVRSSF